ncbi:M16 family metallopeptidase [Sphaerotilus sp.]|uniref:M16 family metallopeptidase n=1 Tax=Sphaerotilus sp. TaxID=2093942 RepID=UPI0025CF8006|nr:pitrilysin family protein [Sphaerotilus sp.]
MKRRTFGHWLVRQGGAVVLGAGAGGCAAPVSRPVSNVAVAGQAATRTPDETVSARPASPLPEPGPPPVLHIPARTEERLGDHGLTLTVAPRPGLPLVSVALVLRCGSAFDPPGRRGTAELMVQCWMRGVLRRGRPVEGVALARQAQALGGAVSVRVEERWTMLEMTVLAPRAGAALALLSDVLRHPLLAPADLPGLRGQARDALALRLQDPAQLAALVARRTAWGAESPGSVTTPASLMAVRHEDVLALHRRWVRPDRVAVVLAGDIDVAGARALAGPVLEGWARPAEPLAAEPAEPGALPEPLLPQTLLLHLPAVAQTSVLVCAPFVGTEAADHAAGTLAAAVVGAGHSARLNQEVRVRRGLSYGVTGRTEPQRLTGLFVASAQTEHAHAAEVAALMQTQLLALAQQPVGSAELVARRAAMIGALARQLDTTSGLVARIGEEWALGHPVEWLSRWPARLEAVSPAQVRAFAQQHWTAARLRTVIAGPVDRIFAATAWPAGAVRLEASALVLDSPSLRR